jgi:protein-tyrosine-phosphatase
LRQNDPARRAGHLLATALCACLRNAGRSQRSAALFERAAGGRHRALSAAWWPSEVVEALVIETATQLGDALASS